MFATAFISLPFDVDHTDDSFMVGACCNSVMSFLHGQQRHTMTVGHAGRRAGLWTVIPCQLIVMIGLDIVYCVTAGKSMQFLYHHTCPGWRQGTCAPFGLSAWIVVFAVIQMILSMVSLSARVPRGVVAIAQALHFTRSPLQCPCRFAHAPVHAAARGATDLFS